MNKQIVIAKELLAIISFYFKIKLYKIFKMKQNQIIKLASIVFLLIGVGCNNSRKISQEADKKDTVEEVENAIADCLPMPYHIKEFYFEKISGYSWKNKITFSGNYYLNSNVDKTYTYSGIKSVPTFDNPFIINYSTFQPTCAIDVINFDFKNGTNTCQTSAYFIVKPSRVPPPNKVETYNETFIGIVAKPIGKKDLEKTPLQKQHDETDSFYKHLLYAKFTKELDGSLTVELKIKGRYFHPSIYYLNYDQNSPYRPNYITVYTHPHADSEHTETFIRNIPGIVTENRLLNSYVLLTKPWDGSYDQYPQYLVNCEADYDLLMNKVLAFHF